MGHPRSRSLHRAVLVAVLLAATTAGALVTAHTVENQQRARFETQTERLDVAFAERFTAYEQVLRGAVGLFRSSGEVTRRDWDTYVRSLRLDDRYPGFKSLSYAPAVDEEDLAGLVRDVRREVVPEQLGDPGALRGYALRAPAGSSGTPEVHSPILYVAPFTEVNRRVLGVDMMLEPTRREVMLRAAATGQAVASPRLRLSGSSDDEAGFIVYVPVKKGRRVLGWVTAAFLADAFADGIEVARGTSLDIEVFDGVAGASLLFSTAGTDETGAPLPLADIGEAPYDATSQMPVPGGTWSARYLARSDFVSLTGRMAPWIVALVGLLATLALWLLARGGDRWRRQTIQLEEQAVGLTEARIVAESATRATSAFLATMSHEIRTPLNAVVGAGTLLRDTELDPEQEDYVRVIRTSGDHVLQVISEILDYSKLEADRVELERTPFDPAECVRSVMELMGGAARDADVTLTSEVDLPPVVLGDASRLRQVLLNLVSNAVKFTPARGVVTVSAHGQPGQRIQFAVQDTGVGLAPEQHERLFEPFTQAEASTSRTHGGTGLGLSIARRLVDAMGGTLEVDSQLGRGARFHFSMDAPAAVATERATLPPQVLRSIDHDAPTTPLRILVAEDDEMNQLLVERILVRLGHRPDIVADGAAAVAAAREADYDVVFLDLHMPVLNGVDAAKEIRDLSAAPTGPYLVAMTGSVSPVDHESAAAAGIVDSVMKPYSPDDVAAAIERARRWLGQAPGVDPGD